MNKKKLFYECIIAFIVVTIGWSVCPYIFTSNKIISKNNYEYKYKQIDVYKLQDDEELFSIKQDNSNKMNDFINAIDELKVKRTTMSVEDRFHDCLYDIEFTATYKGKDNITCTNEVFNISLYKNNIIGFQESPTHKEKFYKIQDEKFKSEDFINSFKK